MLPVSAPFHCPLMAPAASAMEEALAEVDLREPLRAAHRQRDRGGGPRPEEIRRLLVEQVTGLVRWRESVLAMKERGVHEMLELGAGQGADADWRGASTARS